MVKGALVDNDFDLLSDVVPGRESWRFLVRVVRLWEVPAFLHPEQINSVEMVLVDEKGFKIHATVRKQLLYLFQKKLVEGHVYKLSFFSVAPTSGSYRTTYNTHKLFFQLKTKVNAADGPLIPMYGLNFSNIVEVNQQTVDNDFLIDVIGLMTGMSCEREYIKDGKITKMILLQLTDHSGKCEIALFGEYVDHLKQLMAKAGEGLPVVVVQFAKVKIFRDTASLQNVMNTTRIMINPEIPEVIDFKKGLAVSSIGNSSSVPLIGPKRRASLEEDFLHLHSKKSIAELKEVGESDTFIVYATIDGLVEGQEWWYPACRCHRSVTPDSAAFYCKACVKHVFHIIPRYKVKLQVSDETDESIFILFDTDMNLLLGKQCANLVASSKSENAGFYPAEMDKLKGKKILFKVQVVIGENAMFDGTFRVTRVCVDEAIIELFLDGGDVYSPTKGSSVSLDDDAGEDKNVAGSVEGSQPEESLANVVLTPDLNDVLNPDFASSSVTAKRSLMKDFEDVGVRRSKKPAKTARVPKVIKD